MMHHRISICLLIIALLLQACNLPATATTADSDAIERSAVPSPSATASPTITPSPRPPHLALDHQPLYWFAPLPPQQGTYNGSDDFMELFSPEADWHEASSHLQVFKLYGGWTVYDSTEADREQAITEIRRRGLGLAIETGPLFPTDECGEFIEGFAGAEVMETVENIRDAGGILNFIALDEPYYWAHFYDGENSCQWSTEKIAADVGDMIAQVRTIFPGLIVGDIEPVTGPADAAAYKEWLQIFREVNGYDLAFLHLDMDWSNANWPEEAMAMEAYGKELNIPIGIIYIGNAFEESDESWLAIAGERVKRYELEAGGQPDHVIFQSWTDKPDHALPESTPHTYTWFVKTYFEDKASLGVSLEKLAANLALGKSVRVSRLMAGNEGKYAIDGDSGTLWNSGDDAPQWIEIDLGQAYRIGEIRLLTSQYPVGPTLHRVLGKGPGASELFLELTRFEDFTEDGQWLTYQPIEPWSGIQIVRIETVSSPSWVSWREIEIIIADVP